MLYVIVGVQGCGGDKQPGGDGRGSERRRITDALLATVARGYPPQQAMHAIRVTGGAQCKKRKVVVAGPAGDAASMLAAGRR